MKRTNLVMTLCWLLAAARWLPAEKMPAAWQAWLQDVRPIMTAAEWKVFAGLSTEEDRLRFQASFWKVRDPDAGTAANEFQGEYARRLTLVREKFGGAHTDRGRLYLLLGKPQSVSRFSGEQELVECELWNYSGLSGRGLPPFLNFLFYKPGDVGDFKQFYPGMQNARELVTAAANLNLSAPLAAYQLVRSVSGELADASLSLIPGEGDPRNRSAGSTSAVVMTKVQGLPEKEVSSAYLRDFSAAGGTVRVSESSRRIQGWGDITSAGNGEFWFIHYAMLPDQIVFKNKSELSCLADIALYLSVEDGAGRTIYRQERVRHLDVTAARRSEMEAKKVLFREFCPVVPGRYRAQVTLINKGNGDFFTVQRDLTVGPGAPALLTGFMLVRANSSFMPYAAGGRLLLSDPRFLYGRRDRLCGLVAGAAAPTAVLLGADGSEKMTLALRPAAGGLFEFDQPLTGIADATYALSLRDGGREIARQAVFVMPDYITIQRPFAFERADNESARLSYWAVLAEQYLNLGRPAEAVARLETIPEQGRTPAMVSLLAQACYNNRDHARVLALLENRGGEPAYAELTLLANAAIELKQYDKAAGYLEQLRRYGDTAAVNHLLAAAWTVLGDAAKAAVYHQRALELDKITP